jgi:hypothetical protein
MSPTAKVSILVHTYSGLACVGLRIQGTRMQKFVFDCRKGKLHKQTNFVGMLISRLPQIERINGLTRSSGKFGFGSSQAQRDKHIDLIMV